MIRHIVLLPFKQSLSDTQCLAILKKLGELKEHIPQIHSFSYGKNNSQEQLDRGYTFGFVMEFLNEEDRQIYLDHPLHIDYANNTLIPQCIDGINSPIVFDYSL